MKWLTYTIISLTVALGIALAFVIAPPVIFYVEGGIAIILISLFALDRSIVRPLRAIRTGISLINEQDFSSRLASVGQRDADSIAATFNRMIGILKNERLRVMEQNHFLDMLINASPAGILILNYDGTVRTANPAAVQMLGCRDLVSRRPADIPGRLAAFIAGIPAGSTATVRLDNAAIYRCSSLSFIDSGFQRPFIMIESLSDEIMKAERAAFSKVIRLISHEVNNTMAGIVPILETVEMVSDNAEIAGASASCRERCASLSRFITRYSDVVKLPAPVLRPVSLPALTAALMPFLESMAAGKDITMTLETEGSPSVMADTVLMEQVLVNVVKNSIESIGAKGHITLTVSDSPACITVSDNGQGISPEAAGNLFSPFYSSKKGGQGIGLTLVSEILRAHRCMFSLQTSDTDGLTRFSICFPAFSGQDNG